MASGRPKRETSSDSLSSAHFLDRLMAPPPPRSSRSGRPSTTNPSSSTTTAPSKKRKQPDDPNHDDLFGPLPASPSEIIDLVDTDIPPLASKPPPPKNEIRLSAFQCVICMDDVTNLTVTHCGTPSPPPPDGLLTDCLRG